MPLVSYNTELERLEGPGWTFPAANYLDSGDLPWGRYFEASIRIRHKKFLSVQWDDQDRANCSMVKWMNRLVT